MSREGSMNAIPISRAFVCCQCSIVIATAQVCPACGSAQSIASLSAWLNRRSLDEVRQALDMASAVRAK